MKLISLILFGLLVFSCQKNKFIKTYACVSHTRLNTNNEIDSTVTTADLEKYDILLLGGDLANLSSDNDSILSHLDSIFNFSQSQTLWALGNHDYTHVERVKSYTKRGTYYAYYQDKTTFIVLDTQKDSSRIIGEQLKFFNKVMDTIAESKNLIVLTHKLIWLRDHPVLESKIDSISNGHLGNCDYCVQKNNFYESIYPKLTEFSDDTHKVFCIAGDIGFNVRKFEFKTKDGIQYLATGIKGNEKSNLFLEIQNNLKTGSLNYEFKSLTNL